MSQKIENIALLDEYDGRDIVNSRPPTGQLLEGFDLPVDEEELGELKEQVVLQPQEHSLQTLLLTFIPMMIGAFMASMDSTIVMASYASIGNELKKLQSTSWISTGYMLTLASLQPLYGKLSDIFGRKACLLGAYVLFTIGCVACSSAQSMSQLIVARAIAGMGGGGMTTIVTIIMSDLVSLRSRGNWHAALNMVWAAGSAVGAPLGGYIADTVGWRWSFLLQIPLAVFAFTSVASIFKPAETSGANFHAKLQRVDFAGSVCLITALGSLLVALDRGGNIGWSDQYTIASFACAAVFAIAFVHIERNVAREPVVPKRTWTNPALTCIYLTNMAGCGTGLSITYFISLYIRAVSGRPASLVGAALLPSIIANVVGSLCGGTFIQLTGGFKKITVGLYAVGVVGAITIALSTGLVWHSFAALEIGFFLVSLGNGCGMTTTLVALVAEAGSEDQAVASGVLYLCRSLGSVLCLSLCSTIFQESLRMFLGRDLHGEGVDEVIRVAREALTSVDGLDPQTRAIVHGAYEKALQVTFMFCVVLALATFTPSLWMREKSLSRGKR